VLNGFLEALIPPASRHLVWLVGGSVRDLVQGSVARDIDLLAALPPDSLAALGFRPVAAKTAAPIWFRHFPGVGNVEIALLESAAGLDADLQRRDFTINAMAMTLEGALLDPLRGKDDLQLLTLRACSPRSFSADPLRLFRAFRFEAEGFSLAEETAALIRRRDWDEDLQRLPVERFSRELLKALAATEPQRFFLGMLEFGVGRNWLAGLFRMAAIPAGPLEHHPEGDLLTHSLQVLERVAAVSPSPLARFCAFFHDIGKLATAPEYYPKHHGHDEAGFRAAEQFCRSLALPLEYGRALAWVSRLHGNANRLEQLRPATKLRMVEQAVKAGIGEILPLVSAADKQGQDIPAEWHRVAAVAAMSLDAIGIDMDRLHAVKPAKRSEFILQKRVEFLKQQTALILEKAVNRR
jgi:tRNA nucleotidyltransferase (CCA-adding enzyme)